MKHAERFFEQIRAIRATGAAVPETSYYPALAELLQISSRSTLQPLDLVGLVEGACQALNRVDRGQFFRRFEEGAAVQYF